MLKSIFDSTSSTSIDVGSLLICFLVSIILGFMIAMVHRGTAKSSKNFLITVCLLPILVQSVMLMVNGNLGTSIAIMGAFSLVRFRSIPGTSREIIIVFFAMAVGLATGIGQIWFAVILTILGSGMIILFNKIRLFENSEKVLKVLIPENLDYEEVFDDIFFEYTNKINLIKSKTTNMGSMFELTYSVVLKDNVKEKDFIDKIRMRNGNLKVILSSDIDNVDL